MSTQHNVQRDERTLAVENASYGWAYALLTYALLIDVAYRGLIRNEAAWDLMAFVIVASGFCTAYQARQKVFARGWLIKAILVAGVAAAVAALAAIVTLYTRS